VLEHLLSLCSEDLRLRFGNIVTARTVVSYAAHIDFDTDIVLALCGESAAPIGIAQVMRLPSDGSSSAEIAFSVVPGSRGLGFGHRLMREVIATAYLEHIRSLVAQMCPDNAPMLAIVRRAGMRLVHAHGEVTGTLALPSA
jgi:acetyltransferase